MKLIVKFKICVAIVEEIVCMCNRTQGASASARPITLCKVYTHANPCNPVSPYLNLQHYTATTMRLSPILSFAHVVSAFLQQPLTSQHPQLRIRSHAPDSSICPAGSNHYTGFVDLRRSCSLFFWYFESRNDPGNDPVVVWLNGFV